jgi:hypothetical protein
MSNMRIIITSCNVTGTWTNSECARNVGMREAMGRRDFKTQCGGQVGAYVERSK